MKSSSVLIHFPKTDSVKNHLKDLGFNYQESKDEYDLIVDDVAYNYDHYVQDPDEQLCELYGINYDLVNCIEAL